MILTTRDGDEQLGITPIVILPQRPPILCRKVVWITRRRGIAHMCKLFTLLVAEPFGFDGTSDGIGYRIPEH